MAELSSGPGSITPRSSIGEVDFDVDRGFGDLVHCIIWQLVGSASILEGHHCHPSIVEGLELWSSENGVIAKASEAEIANLRKRSAKVHARFSKLLAEGMRA